MALVLGLDIGTRSITGAVFAGTPKKFRLVDFFRKEVPSIEILASSPRAEGAAEEYDAPQSIEELIQKVVAEHNLDTADLVVAADAKDCILREIPVQFTREEQISKVIHFAAEEYLPTMNLEDVVLEYAKTGEANGKSTVILFALKNEVIEARLGLLKRAGLDPVALDLDASALFNAFAVSPLYDPTKSTLLIDMGATSAKIVLVEEGKLKKVRAFRAASRRMSPDRLLAQPAAVGAGGGAGGDSGGIFGGDSIETRLHEIEEALRRLDPVTPIDPGVPIDDLEPGAPIAILSDEEFDRVQHLMASQEEAESAAHAGAHGGARRAPPRGPAAGNSGRHGASRPGDGASEETFDYREYLERIGVEVQRTLGTSRSGVELICLTGGMSHGEEARRYLGEELDVETVHLDFGDEFPADLGAEQLGEVNLYGAVAVGLAMKELGRDQTGLDFRKGRFRYEHRFNRLRFPLLAASALSFVFFLQTAFWAYHDYMSLVDQSSYHESQMREIYKTFFGKEAAVGRDPLVAAQEQQKSWKGKGVGDVGKVIPFVDAIRNFGEIMKGYTGNNQNFFKLKSMNLSFRVKSKGGSGAKKATLDGEPSTVELSTKDNGAHLALQNKFNNDPVSKFFDAKGSIPSIAPDGEAKVILTLTPKQAAMARLE